LLLLFPALLFGCSKTNVTVSGSVDGHKLEAVSAFWGGPHIVIADAEFDCVDMPWVEEEYEEDADNAVDTEVVFSALQFTYESSEVEEGKLSIRSRESPVYAWFLLVEDEVATAYQATSGTLELEIDKKERVDGEFKVTFGDDGSLTGEFVIENCNNLKKRKYE